MNIRLDENFKFLAHTKDGKTFVSEEESQGLEEHLENVAKYAQERGAAFGAGNAAKEIARLHDFGKYDMDFQHKIRGLKKNKRNSFYGGGGIIK